MVQDCVHLFMRGSCTLHEGLWLGPTRPDKLYVNVLNPDGVIDSFYLGSQVIGQKVKGGVVFRNKRLKQC